MSDLNITNAVTENGKSLNITISGKLTIETAAELQTTFLKSIDNIKDIKLDISTVQEIDIAGMQVICSACRTYLDAKRQFNFTGCMAQAVKSAISAVGLQRQITCKHNADLPCLWCGGIN